jgi:hypothetical protein
MQNRGCVYCGKRISQFFGFSGEGRFCSREHRAQYEEESTQRALELLRRADEQLSRALARLRGTASAPEIESQSGPAEPGMAPHVIAQPAPKESKTRPPRSFVQGVRQIGLGLPRLACSLETGLAVASLLALNTLGVPTQAAPVPVTGAGPQCRVSQSLPASEATSGPPLGLSPARLMVSAHSAKARSGTWALNYALRRIRLSVLQLNRTIVPPCRSAGPQAPPLPYGERVAVPVISRRGTTQSPGAPTLEPVLLRVGPCRIPPGPVPRPVCRILRSPGEQYKVPSPLPHDISFPTRCTAAIPFGTALAGPCRSLSGLVFAGIADLRSTMAAKSSAWTWSPAGQCAEPRDVPFDGPVCELPLWRPEHVGVECGCRFRLGVLRVLQAPAPIVPAPVADALPGPETGWLPAVVSAQGKSGRQSCADVARVLSAAGLRVRALRPFECSRLVSAAESTRFAMSPAVLAPPAAEVPSLRPAELRAGSRPDVSRWIEVHGAAVGTMPQDVAVALPPGRSAVPRTEVLGLWPVLRLQARAVPVRGSQVPERAPRADRTAGQPAQIIACPETRSPGFALPVREQITIVPTSDAQLRNRTAVADVFARLLPLTIGARLCVNRSPVPHGAIDFRCGRWLPDLCGSTVDRLRWGASVAVPVSPARSCGDARTTVEARAAVALGRELRFPITCESAADRLRWGASVAVPVSPAPSCGDACTTVGAPAVLALRHELRFPMACESTVDRLRWGASVAVAVLPAASCGDARTTVEASAAVAQRHELRFPMACESAVDRMQRATNVHLAVRSRSYPVGPALSGPKIAIHAAVPGAVFHLNSPSLSEAERQAARGNTPLGIPERPRYGFGRMTAEVTSAYPETTGLRFESRLVGAALVPVRVAHRRGGASSLSLPVTAAAFTGYLAYPALPDTRRLASRPVGSIDPAALMAAVGGAAATPFRPGAAFHGLFIPQIRVATLRPGIAAEAQPAAVISISERRGPEPSCPNARKMQSAMV